MENKAIYRGKTPGRTVLLLAWPIILEQIMVTLTSNVDTIMVSTLGANATAAIAINMSIVNLVNAVVMSFGIGLTAMVARAVGADDHTYVKKVVAQGGVLALGMGVFFTTLMCVLSPYIPRWMGGEEDILKDASAYLFWLAVTMLFKTISVLFTAVLRGVGNAATPMRINIVVNVVNVIFNFLLIYPSRVIKIGDASIAVWGAGLGVAGAAIATSIGIAVGGVMMLWVMFFKDSAVKLTLGADYRPDKEILSRIIKISLPATGERLAMSFGQIAQTYIVTSLGTLALAAHHLAASAESLCFMPPFGFSAATTTLVGQALGAEKPDLAETFAKEAAKMATLMMTVTATIMFLGAPQIMNLFIKDPEVIRIGTNCLRIVAFSEPFLAVALALMGALRGAGDTKWPFYIVLFSTWIVRIIPALIAVFGFGAGLSAVWIFMCADVVMRCVLAVARFRTGRWKNAYSANFDSEKQETVLEA